MLMDSAPPLVLKAGDALLPFADVKRLDLARLETGVVAIVMKDGDVHEAHGFDAVEAVMAVRPSAMEGRRLRWRPHAWAFHNLVAHPAVQVLAWCGWKRAAVRFHDWTTPRPRGFRDPTV
jgi:hypothetical protein